ncbi:Amino Acid-Polyamine-Organocation (APC) protein [Phytophthora megakarya]|uniref:Amino Acid-Polyamine-Organocation (APC) protein n=1 Tax=Phytophthora megakarya TaxID=4795 RepID=A0A225W6M4_9STRA|nr:Amino Acid-Polyamine-Organocation (APC) protein [Phytophthora megakarya]
MTAIESPLVALYDQSLATPKRLERLRDHSTVSVVSSVDHDEKVCGGPIGSEPIISAGGPLIGLILLLLFPIILGLPIAYVTAELSTAYPEDGGYTVWVLHAFGPFWGFQTGYWAWISGVIDNALYPGLAVSTFTEVYGHIGSPTAEYFIKAAIAVALTLPNLLGIRVVGNGMVVLSIFVMIPFIMLFVWGLVSGHHWSALGEMRRSDIVYDSNGDLVSMTGSLDIDWSTLINTLFWNFNGAVGMSVFGGEVSNPGQTYPRAMLISVLLIALTYLMPLFGATVFNSPNWTTWDDGSFSGIASALGGTFLSTWIMLASFASNAGMYIAELFCDSFQIMGMADNGLAPTFLKARNKQRNKQFNTPHNAVLASLVVILILIEFDFDDIVNMTNALSAFYQILIFAAFIKLRYTHADLKRPYKVHFPFNILKPRHLISQSLSMTISKAVHSPKGVAYDDQLLLTPERLDRLNDHSYVSIVSNGSVQWRPSALEPAKEDLQRQLTVLGIVGLCYFSVCGGPIGSEYIISSGGPLVGFIFLILFPFILGLPIAFVTAELSTAYPHDGGYTVWVLHAFGPFWAFQTGYWSWISGVIDNAIYPGLAVATVTEVYGSIGSPTAEYFIKAAIAVMLALPNLFGIQIVGNGMAALSVFVMIPFIVLAIWGVVKASDWSVLGEVRRSDIVYNEDGDFVSMSGGIDINWSTLINTLFWNFNGAVGMSVFGGEVFNPGRTYPRAMLISVLLIALTYIIPLFGATVFNSPHWTTWEDGSFSSIASDLGGEFLSTWIMLASFGSNAGMYIAELFCDSFQIMGMAQCGLAPAFLKTLIVIFVLIKFDFDDILNMTNALSAFYQILIFAAFIKLRYTQPELHRPFKVPGSMPMICIGLLIPTALLVYIAVDVFFTLAPALIVVGVTLAGLLYGYMKRFSRVQFRDLGLEA